MTESTDTSPKNTLPAGMKPWQKGQSGNPNGRPKRIGFIGELIREHLQETIVDPKSAYDGKARIEEAINRLYKEDPKTYFAYGFGKPIETQVQLKGDEQDKEFAKEVAREWARTGVDPRNKPPEGQSSTPPVSDTP